MFSQLFSPYFTLSGTDGVSEIPMILFASLSGGETGDSESKAPVLTIRSHYIFFLQPGVSHQHTTHLLQRPCYKRGSPCQDPAGNRTTRRPPDHRKETQTALVWTCLWFIGFDQNHPAEHSEREKKTRQTEKEVGRQHQGMDLSLIHI